MYRLPARICQNSQHGSKKRYIVSLCRVRYQTAAGPSSFGLGTVDLIVRLQLDSLAGESQNLSTRKALSGCCHHHRPAERVVRPELVQIDVVYRQSRQGTLTVFVDLVVKVGARTILQEQQEGNVKGKTSIEVSQISCSCWGRISGWLPNQ